MGFYDSTVKQQLFRVETGRADWNVAAITVRAGISTAAKTGEGGGASGKGGEGNFTSFDPFSVQLAVLPCSTQAQSSRTITVASKRVERGILSCEKDYPCMLRMLLFSLFADMSLELNEPKSAEQFWRAVFQAQHTGRKVHLVAKSRG